MKYININLTDPAISPIYEKTAGRKGESLVKGVKFTLPPNYSGWSAFVETENAKGEKSRDLTNSYSENVVVYEFTRKDLKYKGRLLLDLVLENEDSVYKPFHGEFAVKNAICATDDISLDGVDIDLTSIALKRDIPTKLSQLKNDKNFITSDDLPPNPIPEITEEDDGGILRVVEGEWEIQKFETIQGSDGKDGVGISSISLNEDYTLTIVMSDGTSYTTESVRGEKGERGDTPEVGVDYFTDKDKDMIVSAVIEELPDVNDGQDGYSPTINIVEVDGGHKVSITDREGEKTFVVTDGVIGKDGEKGQDGQSATHVWNGTVLTITSASGTSSTDLKGEQGEKGSSGVYVGDGDMPDDCNVQINPNGVATNFLPSVDSSNNGNFLRVIGGNWEVSTIDFAGADSGILDYIVEAVIGKIPEWTGDDY